MVDPVQFFTTRFPVTLAQIETLLGIALSQGGDFADLYFEHNVINNLSLEEQIIKSAGRSTVQGVGVRVIAGERTGYAYCDTIEFASISKAAKTAAQIASQPCHTGPVAVEKSRLEHDLYRVEQVVGQQPLEERIILLQELDKSARRFDPRIREVQASLTDEYKIVLIATSNGTLCGDVQPLARMRALCIADDDGNLQSGVSGGGGRYGLDYFDNKRIHHYANEPFFQGHYPGQPIMPGVLIVEAMAQLGGLLLSSTLEHTGRVALLLSLDKVKLRKAVTPGDQLVLEAETIRANARTASLKCRASVAGKPAAEAEIRFMMVDSDQT